MKRVLLIEDNCDINDTTCEMLEIAGYETITVRNGKDGIIKALKYLPDIILCDMWMPEKDGYEVLLKLKGFKETSKIPFVFFSANTDPKAITKGMEMGATNYICKPFSEKKLLKIIEKSLILS